MEDTAEEDAFCITEEEFPPLPITPVKSPAAKKKASGADYHSLSQISVQLANFSRLVNNRSDSIESKIPVLSDKVELVSVDLKAVTEKVTNIEHRIKIVEQPVKLVQRRMDDIESYLRRWNLKLVGVLETPEENTHLETSKICQNVRTKDKDKLVDVIDIALGRSLPER